MASEKVEAVIASIESLNVLELIELKKTMEDKWGITAAAPMMPMGGMVMPMGGAARPAEMPLLLKLRWSRPSLTLS